MNNQEMQKRALMLHESTDIAMDKCEEQVEKVKKLYDAMQLGQVKFAFTKKDGTIRHAIGTLVKSAIKYEFKGTRHASPLTLPYWDVEKGAFRSFSIVNFVGMEESNNDEEV